MITRVFTLEIVCEGESFHDPSGSHSPWPEISAILAEYSSRIYPTDVPNPLSSELIDRKGNLVGYTMMHEI